MLIRKRGTYCTITSIVILVHGLFIFGKDYSHGNQEGRNWACAEDYNQTRQRTSMRMEYLRCMPIVRPGGP